MLGAITDQNDSRGRKEETNDLVIDLSATPTPLVKTYTQLIHDFVHILILPTHVTNAPIYAFNLIKIFQALFANRY